MELVIDPRGECRLIYDETFDLDSLGGRTIERASHVEPTATGEWLADLSPVGGLLLGPFAKRSAALLAEAEWLAQHWLTGATSR